MDQSNQHELPRRELLNPLGANGRDCPLCFRVGSLTGTRLEGLELQCLKGCGAGFRYREKGLDSPQLERIRLELYEFQRCGRCGGRSKFGSVCTVCEAQVQREARA
jgi:hypothetical protein